MHAVVPDFEAPALALVDSVVDLFNTLCVHRRGLLERHPRQQTTDDEFVVGPSRGLPGLAKGELLKMWVNVACAQQPDCELALVPYWVPPLPHWVRVYWVPYWVPYWVHILRVYWFPSAIDSP